MKTKSDSHAHTYADPQQDGAAPHQPRPQGTSRGYERLSVGHGGATANSHGDGWPFVGTHQSHDSASAASAADRAHDHAHAASDRDGPPNVGAQQSCAIASAASAGHLAQEVKLPQSVVPPAVVIQTATSAPWTDIQVEDSEFPWPSKNPDASEGWVDNRGDFQYY